MMDRKDALVKAGKYCASEDRCRRQVIRKLQEWGAGGQDTDFILSELVTQGFLDEERFARAYARGKFNLNHWGRVMIRANLRQMGIPPEQIIKGLEEIDDAEYQEMLDRLLQKKNATLPRGETMQKRRLKLTSYAVSKGYETERVITSINQMLK